MFASPRANFIHVYFRSAFPGIPALQGERALASSRAAARGSHGRGRHTDGGAERLTASNKFADWAPITAHHRAGLHLRAISPACGKWALKKRAAQPDEHDRERICVEIGGNSLARAHSGKSATGVKGIPAKRRRRPAEATSRRPPVKNAAAASRNLAVRLGVVGTSKPRRLPAKE